MQKTQIRVERWRRMLTRHGLALALAGVLATAGAVLMGLSGEGARAIAPCVAHTNTAEEVQFLGLVQEWRDANISGSLPLTRDDRLNQAAAGYAKFLADNWGAGGHSADGTGIYGWNTRSEQCGYTTNGSVAVGGEALATLALTAGTASISPTQALALMEAHPGSGIWIPGSAGASPVKCVGVGKATSVDGRKVAWVLLLMGRFGECPYPVTGAGSSPTATSSATTVLPTATPTATPTQPSGGLGYRVFLPAVARDLAGEPGVTATSTPTPAPATPAPWATPTSTPTPGVQACAGTAVITKLEKVVWDRVTLSGSGDLAGWTVVSTNGGESFTFPMGSVINGTLTLQSQRIQAERPGQVWWTEAEVWADTENDDAQLFDCLGRLVQTFDDGM